MSYFVCPFCDLQHYSITGMGVEVSCCGEIGRVIPLAQWEAEQESQERNAALTLLARTVNLLHLMRSAIAKAARAADPVAAVERHQNEAMRQDAHEYGPEIGSDR